MDEYVEARMQHAKDVWDSQYKERADELTAIICRSAEALLAITSEIDANTVQMGTDRVMVLITNDPDCFEEEEDE